MKFVFDDEVDMAKVAAMVEAMTVDSRATREGIKFPLRARARENGAGAEFLDASRGRARARVILTVRNGGSSRCPSISNGWKWPGRLGEQAAAPPVVPTMSQSTPDFVAQLLMRAEFPAQVLARGEGGEQ